MWTMDELVARVRLALAARYPGAPNNRIRDLPDRRSIRWYTTTGLVDRPAAMRGRTALYTSRHLLQVVALKRLQADGRTLAQIQCDLAGATDAELATVARVPQELLTDPGPGADDAAAPERPRFWAQSPAAQSRPAQPPAAQSPAAPGPDGATHGAATPLAGVALPGGVVLVLPGTPRAADYPDIAAAARPLLDLLADRGLLDDHLDGSHR
jgi:DNA-binding transcriptional MerR regulator